MQNLLTVAQQVAILFVLIGVGAVMRRCRLVSTTGVESLVNLLVIVVTPCLIVDVFQRPFDPSMLRGLLIAFVVASLGHLAVIAWAHFAVRHPNANVMKPLRLAAVFSNAGFMGIPLEYALLGSDGVFYGVAYVVVFNLLFWSWGLVAYCGSLKEVRIRTLFLNPGSIGVAIGLPFFLFSWNLPSFVGTPVRMMADLNTPLAMIIIGFNLAQAKFGPVLRLPKAYLAGFLRLVFLPLLFLAIIYGIHCMGVRFDGKMAVAITTAASAPVAALTSMFAVRFNRDVSLSVGLVSATTLLSILTMPPIVGLAMGLFGVSR